VCVSIAGAGPVPSRAAPGAVNPVCIVLATSVHWDSGRFAFVLAPDCYLPQSTVAVPIHACRRRALNPEEGCVCVCVCVFRVLFFILKQEKEGCFAPLLKRLTERFLAVDLLSLPLSSVKRTVPCCSKFQLHYNKS